MARTTHQGKNEGHGAMKEASALAPVGGGRGEGGERGKKETEGVVFGENEYGIPLVAHRKMRFGEPSLKEERNYRGER